jgi:hypothetical protein
MKQKENIKSISIEEKRALLKNYLVDDVFVKSIMDTLSSNELDKFISENINTLLVKNKGEDY